MLNCLCLSLDLPGMTEAKHQTTTYTGRERVGESLETPASTGNPPLVEQVFGLFKDYLVNQLDFQGKKLESKQKIDKDLRDS